MSDRMAHLAQKLKRDDHRARKDAVAEWVLAVHELFRDMEAWVKPLVDAEVVALEARLDQEPAEPLGRRVRFDRPTFTLRFPSRTVRFRAIPPDPSRSTGCIAIELERGEPLSQNHCVTLQHGGLWVLQGGSMVEDIPFTEETLADFLESLL